MPYKLVEIVTPTNYEETFLKKEFQRAPKCYQEIKEKHPTAIILLRVGDYYETYCGDAEVCANVLGVSLITSGTRLYRLAGFPHHALNIYLPKLIQARYRVAICEE